jgi:hypothetical protein
MECLACVLTVTFGTTRIADVKSTRRPLYSFLLEDKWTECGPISKVPTGNRNRNLQSCGKVPQPSVPPHSSHKQETCHYDPCRDYSCSFRVVRRRRMASCLPLGS